MISSATVIRKNEIFLKAVAKYRKGDVVYARREDIAKELGVSLSVVDRRLKDNGLRVLRKGNMKGNERASIRREKIKAYVEKHPDTDWEKIAKHFKIGERTTQNDLRVLNIKLKKKKPKTKPEVAKANARIVRMMEYYETHTPEYSIRNALKKFSVSEHYWNNWRTQHANDKKTKDFIKKNSSWSKDNVLKKNIAKALSETNLTCREIAKLNGCSYGFVCNFNQKHRIRKNGIYASKK